MSKYITIFAPARTANNELVKKRTQELMCEKLSKRFPNHRVCGGVHNTLVATTNDTENEFFIMEACIFIRSEYGF